MQSLLIINELHLKIPLTDDLDGKSLLRFIEEKTTQYPYLIQSLCGGNGKCGRCKVIITNGLEYFNAPTKIEKEFLTSSQLEDGYRLACQTFFIQRTIEKVEVRLSIVNRGKIVDSRFKVNDSFNFKLLYPFKPSFSQGIGVVFDIGTTSIAGTLVDLRNDSLLAAASVLNPQIQYGRDIISRLTITLENKELLTKAVFQGLARLLNTLLKNDRKKEEIAEIVVVGNSVMHHFFLGLPIESLAKAPYNAYSLEEVVLKAEDLPFHELLGISGKTIITCPPLIDSFIGSDITMDILYQQLWKKNGVYLLIDFGTNSEIVLSVNGKIFVTSVAAGGAFEGQHISCGMRGVPGAIDRFWFNKTTNHLQYTTVDFKKPIGICGSGIIELLAELFLNGQLDQRGRLCNKKGQQLKRLDIDNTNLFITRKDIEAIQKAKAAVYAGIKFLLDINNLTYNDLDQVIVSGVFGSMLSVSKAKVIGLLPPIDDQKFVIAGNTAEKGARTYLLSINSRKEIKKVINTFNHIELANKQEFHKYFVEGLFFTDIS